MTRRPKKKKLCPQCHGSRVVGGFFPLPCEMCGQTGVVDDDPDAPPSVPAVPAPSAPVAPSSTSSARGAPSGIRTRVTAMKAQHPGPLNDGGRLRRV